MFGLFPLTVQIGPIRFSEAVMQASRQHDDIGQCLKDLFLRFSDA